MNIKKKRTTTLYVLILSMLILFCGCQYIKDSKNQKMISDNKGNLAKKASGTESDVADDGTFVFLRVIDGKCKFYDINQKKVYELSLKENYDINCWQKYKQHLYIMVNDSKNELIRLKDINLKTKEERWLKPLNRAFFIYNDKMYFSDAEEDTGIVKKTDLECNNIKNINLNSNKNGAFLELIYNDKMYYVIQNGIYTCDLGGEGKQCVMKEREIKEIFLGTFDAIDNRLYFLAENLDNKICVYYISLSSFRLSEVVCEDVSCYALGEKGIYYVSEDDGNVYYKTYQNPESIEKTAIENCSNSLLKYGDNGWLIQEQKSVSDGQIYAFNEVKGVSKILFKSNR